MPSVNAFKTIGFTVLDLRYFANITSAEQFLHAGVSWLSAANRKTPNSRWHRREHIVQANSLLNRLGGKC